MLGFALAAITLFGNGASTQAQTVAIDVQAACEVDFLPKTHMLDVDGRVGEYVTLEVHFLDGSTQRVDLDYPFIYNSSSDDPFLKGNEDIPALLQFPPPDKAASEPPIVQYVIAHTTRHGYTRLHACPSPSPAPA
jgi:hypothetical protein